MLRSVFAFFCYLFGDFDFAGSITALNSNFFYRNVNMSLHRHCNVTIHAQTELRQNNQILTHYAKINLCES